ncbi:sugar-binding transcriptional regulator [Clostridium sp. cel8]|jgi:central glycolytic genes regulator|uniref:sugar-binding transcriptional regulator n=1 Tax=Clostridium sp. cel8 TaxID=2663123 RepID=UPI0015F49863|nr:sugar-binding transcriptional regulator [Clostridium sp. cel8]MBA5851336.1 sugar-binding transcriptional regulator [Clostridium sp. cel8]
MEEVLKLQKRIVPELVELLEKRYNILRTIYYNQPIGRRVLANDLGIGERIVRTEINFLKNQGFIDINTPGMTVTRDGEYIIDKLKDSIHELRGLSEVEDTIKINFGLKKVIIVPGNCDEDSTILSEMGRVAGVYLKSILKNSDVIAVTGGSTIKKVVDNMPKISNIHDVLVVPARGGMGANVETQANTLAASLANKVNGTYKMLHVPDNLSDIARDTILKEKSIQNVLQFIYNANVLVYGIGEACKMARRRGLNNEKILEIKNKGALGEAFGYYFDKKGNIVYSTPSIGIKNDSIHNIETLIAVAGGCSKAEAILSVEINNKNGVLITDEGAAKKILELLKSK